MNKFPPEYMKHGKNLQVTVTQFCIRKNYIKHDISFTCMSYFTTNVKSVVRNIIEHYPVYLVNKYIKSTKDRALCNSRWQVTLDIMFGVAMTWTINLTSCKGVKIKSKHCLAEALSAHVLLTPICHSTHEWTSPRPSHLVQGRHGEGDRINLWYIQNWSHHCMQQIHSSSVSLIKAQWQTNFRKPSVQMLYRVFPQAHAVVKGQIALACMQASSWGVGSEWRGESRYYFGGLGLWT